MEMSRQGTALVIALLVVCTWDVGCGRRQESAQGGHAKQAEDSEKEAVQMDGKEEELASLPVGIEVSHSPNPVKAKERTDSVSKYLWIYETTVRTKGGPLTLEEFGVFSWHQGRWVFSNFTGKPFTSQDFAEWYSCPDAELEPSKEYADPTNWTASMSLHPGKAKWYFIARNKKGERVKGEAIVEQLAEVTQQ